MKARDIVTGKAVGQPMDRLDGRLKVSGAAQYSSDVPLENVAYAAVVQSTIARGRVSDIDAREAEKLPGVLTVLTHLNAPRVKTTKARKSSLLVLQDDSIRHSGQNIAVVVAESWETAMHAASLVKVSYQESKPKTDMGTSLSLSQTTRVGEDSARGSVKNGLQRAAAIVDETYSTPTENHNPLEPFATVASWDGDNLTLYETTQSIFPSRDGIAELLGLPPGKVRVVTHFLGGGFGCKLSVWSHAVLAALAARQVKRPVKLVMPRTRMYGPVGFRPRTLQKVKLGATKEGKLTAIKHVGFNETCTFNDFEETVTENARVLYACPNVETAERLVRVDIGNPTWMRAPGHVTGSFALESAMDELACALNLDPLELRLRNYAEKDPESGLPYSSKSLRECYRQGAERFGWQHRKPKAGSMKNGKNLVGMGMATALHGTYRAQAQASTRINPDGTVLVRAGTQDIGTGTYTIMAQVAADALGLPVAKVTAELGDTDLPRSPLSGGSMTAASVGSAVHLSSLALLQKLKKLASEDKSSPLYGTPSDQIESADQRLFKAGDRSVTDSYIDLLARNKTGTLEARSEAAPGDEREKYSMHSFGAHFVELEVDPDLCTIHLKRMVGAFGAGRILNAKTARSQMIGGMIMGVGMALFEETLMDHNLGRIVNSDFAEYHIPVHMDIPEMEVLFVEEKDSHINPIGAKGVGELGITGVAAAIANAVFHATGRRVRDLPITLDKLMHA